jgi:hypothetical protein
MLDRELYSSRKEYYSCEQPCVNAEDGRCYRQVSAAPTEASITPDKTLLWDAYLDLYRRQQTGEPIDEDMLLDAFCAWSAAPSEPPSPDIDVMRWVAQREQSLRLLPETVRRERQAAIDTGEYLLWWSERRRTIVRRRNLLQTQVPAESPIPPDYVPE